MGTVSWDKALELAAHITHPNAVAAFGAVFAVFALIVAIYKKTRIAYLLASIFLILGISPILSSTYLAGRGIYHIRIVVLGPDGRPTVQARLTTSTGGEVKQADGNFEFDLYPQSKPSDGKVTLYASDANAYLSGSSTLSLGNGYYPTVTIQLAPMPSVVVRGIVKDKNDKSVAGASVSVAGYSDGTTTDALGNFSLQSHHADGQQVRLHAEKEGRTAEITALAGRDAEIILR